MEQNYNEEKESGSSFDIANFFSKVLKNWPWFLLTTAIFLVAANFYLRYTIPLFSVSTYIQIKQPGENANLLGGSPFASGGANTSAAGVDANSEIFKLQSAEIVGTVVDSLNLDISVTTLGRVKSKPTDIDSLPFELIVKKAFPDHISPLYKLSLTPVSFRLESEIGSVNGIYNQPLVVQGDTITLRKIEPFDIGKNNLYGVRFLSRTSVVANYVSRIAAISLPKAGVGILQVTVKDELPKRARKFIDVLIHNYDIANREFKNKALHVEMDFLNSRLAAVSTELSQQENLVKDFKAGNRMFDVSSSANQLLSTLPTIDTKKNDNDLKLNLLNLVENNIKSYNGQEDIVPSTSGLQDPVLASSISRYNDLIFQKSSIQAKGTAQDPRLPGINSQLQEIRGNILKNVENIRKEIGTNVSSLTTQEKSVTGKYSGMPGKEKEFIELQRMLGIKQTLYVFLLQRREDKNIQFASADVSESRIIDNRQNSSVQDPKPLLIYGIALAVGLLLPIVIILVKLLLNKNIESRKDVELATSLPIAGEIAQAKKIQNNMVITTGARTPIAEQFRTLRTNIAYLSQGLQHKTYLITSFKTDEGKSFVSLNLANSIAISGKKVVLIEFDLRQPGLSENFGLEESEGLSNYFIGNIPPAQIIRASTEFDNLSFISAGNPLPSNPGEVILSSKMNVLFNYLKENYDYIIIDTPPVGAVSDSLSLSKWADMTFFIVRHKYTLRSSIKLINELSAGKKLPHVSIIINGIQAANEFGYGQSYGYGYGEGYPDKMKKKKNFLKSVGKVAF